MSRIHLGRRKLLGGLAAGTGGLLLAGCDKIVATPAVNNALRGATDPLHYRSQRLISGSHALAQEFSASDMSPIFRENGNTMPESPAYQAHAMGSFADWGLVVDGLVARPLKLTMAQLTSIPARTQITRHDCVEGWSAIGKWSGPQLSTILRQAGVSSRAKYIVFHCADNFGPAQYYESVDMIDAFHPQTILALRMNDAPLSIGHGAPVRLRVERQLGYKHAKYVMRVEARESLAGLYGGKGGYWEDAAGYEWYAGI